MALATAAWKGWKGATSDITGAFLLAEWPEDLPKYGIFPPKLLVQNGYALHDEIWVVDRPLYGLRESPAIWSRCRSVRLASAVVPHDGRTLTMEASSAYKELWLVFDGPILAAMIITYVDDLFYLAEEEVIKSLHRWVTEAWPCSELEWAASEEGTRYLGIEIKQREDCSFSLSQIGYINDVLRSHGMDDAIATKLPCPKEWLAEDEDDGTEEENFSIAELRLGQRIVGEQLWLAMRTKPDLLYAVNYMASKVSKQPNKVAQIGRRLMSYLKETRDIKLIVYGPQYQYDDGSGEAEAQAHSTISSASRSLGSSSNSRSRTTTESASSSLHHPQEQEATRKRYKLPVTLYGYSASFAPFGNRSFGACVVTINDTPKLDDKLL